MRQADHRFLRIGREGVDGIDPVLYVVEQLPRLIIRIHFYVDRRFAFDGTAGDLVDAFEVLYRFLDTDGDTQFNVLGRGAAQGHDYGDDIGLDLRKHVQLQP